MKTAKDIMNPKVITAKPDDPIKKIVAKMDKYDIKEIPIVDNGKLIGMITYYDILDFFRADPNEKISTLMIKPPTVNKDALIEDVIKIMVKTGVEAIPVMEGEKIIGLISDYDILINMLDDKRIKKLKIRDVMEESTKLLKVNDPISEARRIMRFHRWGRLPVVDEDGKLVGMITSIDILRTFYKIPKEKMGRMDKAGKTKSPLMLPVKGLMRKDIPEIFPEDKIVDVLKILLEKKLKGVPVIDKNRKVIGVFERWNLLDKLIERKFKNGVWLNFSGFPLSVETVEMVKDYLSSDIRKMKILCPDLESINIHIKKLHGATPQKWNYEVKIHLKKKAGKGEVVTDREPWYGYNLMFTLQDSFNRLIKQLERKYVKREGKQYYAVKRAGASKSRGRKRK